MQEISLATIEQAIYKMCKDANIYLPVDVYEKLRNSAICDEQNKFILKNAQIAAETQRPLCQDTGQVIVFMDIGQDVHFKDGDLNESINNAVSRCYKDNYFRKSVVKDALSDRTNTNTNTPCVIHYNIITGDEVHIKIMIKGGGSENVTSLKMLNPTASLNQIEQQLLQMLKDAGRNACLPVFVGIGCAKTAEEAILLSKKAILDGKDDTDLCNFFNQNLSIGLKKPVLCVKKLTSSTHIASRPLAMTIVCHSNRYNSCKIADGKILYTTKLQQPECIDIVNEGKVINTSDFVSVKSIKPGEKIYLSGTIFTARDQAHKKLVEMIKNNEQLPFELKNAFIFYAGPCPAKDDEVIGPVGPTTAKRMDEFALELYSQGVLATIAKGDRGEKLEQYAKRNGKKYFEVQGGIASYIANCVKNAKVIAFNEFGTEAVMRLEVEKLPVVCIF